MIVDCHTHIFEAGRGGPLQLPCSADALVRQMDEAGVDVSVVLPLPGNARNGFVQEQCARFPGRLAGLYNPEFDFPRETIGKMEAFFAEYSPPGLKIHPRLQNVRVTDAVVIDVLNWANQRSLPVLFDVFPYGQTLDDAGLHPMAYHAIAQRIPSLRMILAHAGGYRLLEAFMVAKSNPNIYLDLSFTPVYFKGSSLLGDCGFVCQRLPPGRVLYGSDFPQFRLAECLECAREFSADLDSSVKTQFFGDSAAALFGIAAAR
jgi:uncharacterized protein